MAKIGRLQTNFSGGQVDDRAEYRSDTRMWQNGARSLLNVQQLIEGGVRRRPGTRYLAEIDEPGAKRLLPFVFNITQRYLLIFAAEAWYAYAEDGELLDSDTAIWTEEMVADLSFAQEGDTMVITHRDMPPQILLRTGAETFELSEMEFEENTEATLFTQPYYRFADGNVYLTPTSYVLLALSTSGTGTPSGTVTGGTSGETGTVVNTKIVGTSYYVWLSSVTGTFQAGETCSYSGGSRTLQSVLNGAKLVSSTADIFDADDEGRIWRMGYTVENVAADELVDKWFEMEILDRDSDTQVWARDRRGLPTWANLKGTDDTEAQFLRREYEAMPWWTGDPGDDAVIPTDIWQEPAFSDRRGYPRCVAFHGQRLCFGGHAELPANFWLSRVGAYFNFDTGEGQPDRSVQSAVGTGVGHTIRHIVSQSNLILLADNGEFYIPESPTRPLSADSGALRQSGFGANQVVPQIFDSAVLFVQSNNRTIREMRYNEVSDSYQSDPINTIVLTMFSADVVDMAVVYGQAARHEQYAYMVTDDGKMAVFHGNRVEEIASWVPWETDGYFRNVCALRETLFCLTERTVDGGQAFFLEVFEDELTMDCCITIGPVTASAVLTGIDHLEDQEVGVVDSGLFYGFGTVAGGEVEIEEEVTDATVGLSFSLRIETLPPHIEGEEGSIVGEKVRKVRCALKVLGALDMQVGGSRLLTRGVNFEIGQPPTPVEGLLTFRLHGWSVEPTMTILQETPLPLILLGFTLWYAR